MNDVLGQILAADDYTWAIAVVLTICASAIVNGMLSSWMMTGIFAPVLMAGAMVGAWAMRTFLPLPGTDQTIGVIIGCAVGMTATLVPLLFGIRLVRALHDLFIRVPEHGDIFIRSAPPKKPVAVDRTV